MPYHSKPISEEAINALPLNFVKLGRGEEAIFTDVLLRVWFSLAESGSLATLPPVPDIVSFVDGCSFFYLIFHTNPDELKLAPGDRLTSVPPSPRPKASPSKPSTRSPKRPHPYANARPQASQPISSEHRSASSSKASSSKALSSSTPDDSRSELSNEVIGCVYLSYSPSAESTLDIGLALRPEARGRGFGRATITKFLRYSFETLHAHRVVANVFGPTDLNQRESARESGTVRWIFEKIGFVPEGVQRRAAFSAAEGVWRDVYPLSMLDMDWVRLDARTAQGKRSIICPFDALIQRHDTEREEMSDWMDDPDWGQLRRIPSTETIRGRDESATHEPEPAQEDEHRSPSPIQSESSFEVPSEHDWRSVSVSDFDYSDYSVVSHSPPPESIVSSPAPGSASPDAFSNFSLSGVTSPQFNPATPNSDPTPFSMVGSPDLEPPLSPGFSNTGDEVIELASLPDIARHLAAANEDLVDTAAQTSPTAAPYVVEPMPSIPRRNPFADDDGDEPLDLWSSDSEFEGSVRGR